MTERKEGYYWVKEKPSLRVSNKTFNTNDQLNVFYWNGKSWQPNGSDKLELLGSGLSDKDFEEINENRILSPDENADDGVDYKIKVRLSNKRF